MEICCGDTGIRGKEGTKIWEYGAGILEYEERKVRRYGNMLQGYWNKRKGRYEDMGIWCEDTGIRGKEGTKIWEYGAGILEYTSKK